MLNRKPCSEAETERNESRADLVEEGIGTSIPTTWSFSLPRRMIFKRKCSGARWTYHRSAVCRLCDPVAWNIPLQKKWSKTSLPHMVLPIHKLIPVQGLTWCVAHSKCSMAVISLSRGNSHQINHLKMLERVWRKGNPPTPLVGM